jgi:hypothetical protein
VGTRVSLPFKGGVVRTIDGVKATPGRRSPRGLFRRREGLPRLTEAQQPSPPQGIPQFCTVCRKRFYSEAVRPVCSLDCLRRRNAS